MAAYFDMAAGAAALKEFYDNQKVENLAFDDRPFLAMVPKKTDATGKVYPIPVLFETSPGSANFGLAQANQSPAQLVEFLLTLKKDYAPATLDRQAMLASADKQGAFMDFAQLFIDAALQSSANRASVALFGTGTGSIGAVSALPGAGVIQLTNASDVDRFGLNWTLQAAATDGAAPRATLGYVIARDVVNGTITVSATAMGGIAGDPVGWIPGDFLLVQGDSNAKMSGLPAWLPAVKPGSTDNFFNVNRSVDSRLYGINYNGSQQPIEEALIDAALLIRREKGKPRHCITNFGSEAALIKALGARREFVDWKTEGEIGFRGTLIQGPAGPIEIYSDPSCPAATAFLLKMDTWILPSLSTVPHLFENGDGLPMLRVGNADAYEARTGYYGQLGCSAPGWSGQVQLGV